MFAHRIDAGLVWFRNPEAGDTDPPLIRERIHFALPQALGSLRRHSRRRGFMSRSPSTRGFTLAAAGIIVLGAPTAASAEPSTQPAPPTSPVQLTIEPAALQLHVGASADITVTMQNTSAASTTVYAAVDIVPVSGDALPTSAFSVTWDGGPGVGKVPLVFSNPPQLPNSVAAPISRGINLEKWAIAPGQSAVLDLVLGSAPTAPTSTVGFGLGVVSTTDGQDATSAFIPVEVLPAVAVSSSVSPPPSTTSPASTPTSASSPTPLRRSPATPATTIVPAAEALGRVAAGLAHQPTGSEPQPPVADGSGLAATGAPLAALGVVAALLVGFGTVLVRLGRRRRRSATEAD